MEVERLQALYETPGVTAPDAGLPNANLKAMLANDTRHLERVEQNVLSKTQPHLGHSRSIDPPSQRIDQSGRSISSHAAIFASFIK